MAEAKQISADGVDGRKSPATSQSEDAAHAAEHAVHRRSLSPSNLLVVAVTVMAALWGGWWFFDRLTNVYVQDARVASDMLLLSSRVPGQVTDLAARESESVRRGDTLLHIDDRAARTHLSELTTGVEILEASITTLEAQIALVDHRSASNIAAATARLEVALAEQNAAQGDLETAEAEWRRAGPLRERNLLSQQEFEADRNAFRNAEQASRRRVAEVATARAELEEARSERDEIHVLNARVSQTRSEHKRALLQVEQAQTELDYHRILSPIDGMIDELFVDTAEHVMPGQRLLVMHDPRQIWVKANVKETDLRFFDLNSRVEISVDALPDEDYEGTVTRIGGAATSQFALLPNPNPSGNFTKTTQRVEIQIDLERSDPRLKPGMMVELKIPRNR